MKSNIRRMYINNKREISVVNVALLGKCSDRSGHPRIIVGRFIILSRFDCSNKTPFFQQIFWRKRLLQSLWLTDWVLHLTYFFLKLHMWIRACCRLWTASESLSIPLCVLTASCPSPAVSRKTQHSRPSDPTTCFWVLFFYWNTKDPMLSPFHAYDFKYFKFTKKRRWSVVTLGSSSDGMKWTVYLSTNVCNRPNFLQSKLFQLCSTTNARPIKMPRNGNFSLFYEEMYSHN